MARSHGHTVAWRAGFPQGSAAPGVLCTPQSYPPVVKAWPPGRLQQGVARRGCPQGGGTGSAPQQREAAAQHPCAWGCPGAALLSSGLSVITQPPGFHPLT